MAMELRDIKVKQHLLSLSLEGDKDKVCKLFAGGAPHLLDLLPTDHMSTSISKRRQVIFPNSVKKK